MPVRIGFLLVRLFPMYVLVLATDALRLANKYVRERRFDWVLISDEGLPIEASNGIRIECDVATGDDRDLNYALVIAGDDQARALTKRVRNWLLRIDRSRTVLGAVDSGVFLLAASRLIRNRAVTVHPDAASAFAEQYPKVELRKGPVVRDGALLTCDGGLSIVNLMMSLIPEHCGPAVARSVADDMVVPGRITGDRPTPTLARHDGSTSVDEVVQLMERAIEDPLSLRALATRAQRSRRQITREFRHHLGQSPMEYYRKLRLNRAKQLLSQSDLTVSDIATAVGFRSLSAFSRSFCVEFGLSPRRMRANLHEEGNAASVPSVNRHKRLRRC